MSSQFVDEQTRQQYIIGITDILALIFKIFDPVQKQAIYKELCWLDDANLLKKQQYIEEYFDKTKQNETRYLNQLMQLEHLAIENEEREKISQNLIY